MDYLWVNVVEYETICVFDMFLRLQLPLLSSYPGNYVYVDFYNGN